ncbi:MAG TPA: transposase, partial [Burkholderiales bacterium]|nr:transposase [Burkholderiales bacterium]
RFTEHLVKFYCAKPLFWHRAYFVGSVGGATLETVRAYVDAQGTEEHARKLKPSQKPNRPLDPLLAQGWRGTRLRGGMRGQVFML